MISVLDYQAQLGRSKLLIKLLLTMQLIAFLMLGFSLSLSAKTFAQKITIEEKNISIS